MVSQQLKVYAPHVAQRCLELGRHNPDYNIGIQHGLDISTDWISSPLVVYHTKQAIVTSIKQNRENEGTQAELTACNARTLGGLLMLYQDVSPP